MDRLITGRYSGEIDRPQSAHNCEYNHEYDIVVCAALHAHDNHNGSACTCALSIASARALHARPGPRLRTAGPQAARMQPGHPMDNTQAPWGAGRVPGGAAPGRAAGPGGPGGRHWARRPACAHAAVPRFRYSPTACKLIKSRSMLHAAELGLPAACAHAWAQVNHNRFKQP